MTIINITGYKFTPLSQLEALKSTLTQACEGMKGTILLSHEGINILLAGESEHIHRFKSFLATHSLFHDMTFRESITATPPFKRFKIKIKNEIITLKQESVDATHNRAPSISPTDLKNALDHQAPILLLDTRNDYEIRFGTFKNSMQLPIKHFSEFPDYLESIPQDQTIVMFCTGGIRCEKAALLLQAANFKNVFQLEGGILNYFAQAGGAHYEGECYVFDDRIAVGSDLKPTGTQQCIQCQGPMTEHPERRCESCRQNSGNSRLPTAV